MENLIWKGKCTKPGSPRGGIYFVFQCLYCQKPFVSPGYEVNAGRMTKYCSNDCISADYYNKELLKDGGTMYAQFKKDKCELCQRQADDFMKIGNGRKRHPLLVHHTDMNRRNSTPANLKTVCFSCHMRIHNPSYFGKYPEFQKW